MHTRAHIIVSVLIAAGVTVLGGNTALAAGDDDGRVIRTGLCSGSTDWKIKAKPDDGRIEVEAEIDSNRAGQTWAWSLRHNGTSSARGSSVTGGRSGSFEVERRTVNAPGSDRFVFRGTNARTGEVCVARVSL